MGYCPPMKAQLREKSDIPNQAGFALHLVRPDGTSQLARVAVEPDTGCHYCATASGKRIDLGEFWGWVPYQPPTGPALPGFAVRGSPDLLTRDQLRAVLNAWGFPDEREPAKGRNLVLSFPPSAVFPAVIVQVWDPEPGTVSGKSTDGKTLFAVWYYARA